MDPVRNPAECDCSINVLLCRYQLFWPCSSLEDFSMNLIHTFLWLSHSKSYTRVDRGRKGFKTDFCTVWDVQNFLTWPKFFLPASQPVSIPEDSVTTIRRKKILVRLQTFCKDFNSISISALNRFEPHRLPLTRSIKLHRPLSYTAWHSQSRSGFDKGENELNG
jgi:hypothetical protein